MASKSSISGLLECSICLERFTQPKILPCQHTYCYHCLINLCRERKRIRCPQCREEHTIPANGVIGFKDSLLVKNLLDMSIENLATRCADCTEARYVSPCEHCQESVCTPCLVQHASLSSELKTTLHDLNDYLATDDTRIRICKKKEKLKKFVTSLKNEEVRIQKLFDSVIEKLTKRRMYVESFMRIVARICGDLANSADNSVGDETYIAELSKKLSVSKTVESLTDLKGRVSDFKTIARLVVSKEDQFRFVGDAASVNADIGEIHMGDSVLDMKGRYDVDLKSKSVTDKSCYVPKPLTDETERTAEARKIAERSESCLCATTAKIDPAPECTSLPVKMAVVESTYCNQKRFPRNVNYKKKANVWKTIIGQGRYVKDESLRLISPYSSAYHVENDDVYVADNNNDRIMLYNSDGKDGFVFYRNFRRPTAVAVSSDGEHIFILRRTLLCKVELNGNVVRQARSFPLGKLVESLSLCCYDGHVAVLEKDYCCIIVYNNDLEYVRHFGDEELHNPESLTMSNTGDLFVIDDDRVVVFAWGDQLSKTIHLDSGGPNDKLAGICVDGDGYVCVSRSNPPRIDVYDSAWQFHTSFGELGTRPGQLDNPWELCLMPDGRLIVADSGNHRIQIF